LLIRSADSTGASTARTFANKPGFTFHGKSVSKSARVSRCWDASTQNHWPIRAALGFQDRFSMSW
jgi:hypothetical protein